MRGRAAPAARRGAGMAAEADAERRKRRWNCSKRICTCSTSALTATREAVAAALPQHGVTRALEACCDAAGIPRVLALCEAWPHIYGSAGVHPHSAGEWDARGGGGGGARASPHPRVVAVGEIGLDYHYDFAPREAQRRAFAEQLDIAAAHGLPVLIHDREAHGDCLALLGARRGRLRGVMHCFSGSYETARECLDLGLYIAFGGALTVQECGRCGARSPESMPLERLARGDGLPVHDARTAAQHAQRAAPGAPRGGGARRRARRGRGGDRRGDGGKRAQAVYASERGAGRAPARPWGSAKEQPRRQGPPRRRAPSRGWGCTASAAARETPRGTG